MSVSVSVSVSDLSVSVSRISVHSFRQVMQLQPSVKDKDSDMVALKIVPSEIHVERKNMIGSMMMPFDVFFFFSNS